MASNRTEIVIAQNLCDNGHGYKYCLITLDYGSKFVQFYPMASIVASEVAYNLYEMICSHGCPEKIMCRLGKCADKICNTFTT